MQIFSKEFNKDSRITRRDNTFKLLVLRDCRALSFESVLGPRSAVANACGAVKAEEVYRCTGHPSPQDVRSIVEPSSALS